MSSALPLRIEGLIKRFGPVTAVDGITLDLQSGESLGLLGPNGAGKSTLIRSIVGRVIPNAGTISVFGSAADSTEARLALGWVPQELALYSRLTSRENLESFGRYHGLSGVALRQAVEWCLTWAALLDRAEEPVANLSGGMKRRLNMAAGLVHQPKLILMDEPTVGVDPQSRNRIFEMIEELHREGTSMIYTTHYMEEAERLCDSIIIIDRGKVIANDTLEAVRRLVPSVNVLEIGVENPGQDGWLDSLRAVEGVSAAEWDGSTLRVTVRDLLESSPRVLVWLRQRDYVCSHLTSQRADLETVFLTLTGRSVRNA
jgi:ABC-2 type transport system ATP-binding protein